MEFDQIDLDVPTEKRLLELYTADPAAMPYCHPLWVRLLADAMDRRSGLVVAHLAGRVVAALPFIQRRFGPWSWSLLEALPYDCYAFPLVDPAAPPEDRDDAIKGVYRRLFASGEIARCFPPEWLGLGLPPSLREESKIVVVNTDEIYLKRLSFAADEAALSKSYSQHHRRKLKAFDKGCVTARESSGRADLDNFYELLVATMGRQGLPVKFPRSTVVDGGEQLIDARLGRLYLAEHNGRLCAGVFALRSKKLSVFWLGATSNDDEAMRHAPMYGVMQRAILDAWRNGAEAFELGAAPTKGLRDFKSRWGAEPAVQPTYQSARPLVRAALRSRAALSRMLKR